MEPSTVLRALHEAHPPLWGTREPRVVRRHEPVALCHRGRDSREVGDSVRRRMDPQPPPLDGWPPPLPPPMYSSPPAPPAWPAPVSQEAPSTPHLVRWTLSALTFIAVAAVVAFVFIGRHPAALTSIPAPKQAASPSASASPSATPVSAAVAEAGQQYLAAVVPVNADGSRFHAALLADEGLPCTCSPGDFEVRADALAVIPAIDRDTEALQVVLQTIKHEVPAIAADIDAVVLDNQQYTGYLAAAYRASQTKDGQWGTTSMRRTPWTRRPHPTSSASAATWDCRLPRAPRTALGIRHLHIEPNRVSAWHHRLSGTPRNQDPGG